MPSNTIWERKGLIFRANTQLSWVDSHVYLPTAFVMPNCIRVYVAFWDKSKMGRIGYVDVDLEDPTKVIGSSIEPLLDVGDMGTFDEHGVSPLCAIQDAGGVRLYYAGWQRSESVRYFLFTGLAVSQDGGHTFNRYQNVPVIDRSPGIWQVRTGGCFLKEEDGWHCWYGEFAGWVMLKSKKTPQYNWCYMYSEDGIHWPERGELCLSVQPNTVFGYGRASILVDKAGMYHGWISVRTVEAGYQIRYYQSKDKIHWERPKHAEQLDLLPRESGFDSEETSFASIVRLPDGRVALFYNGRNFGEDGLAMAISQDSDIFL